VSRGWSRLSDWTSICCIVVVILACINLMALVAFWAGQAPCTSTDRHSEASRAVSHY